ncbi:MAG: CPBP family intramembrane metalloprotease [Bacteroidetes bacterium]|nr:CPBP family intramembrane metalloprotease [Bacteroidota bacterium]
MGLQKILNQSLLRGVLSGSIYFISVILSLLIQIKFLDRSSFEKYGLKINKLWINDFLFGSFISFIQLVLFFIIMYLSENLEFVDYFVTSAPDYSFLEGFLSEMYGLLIGGVIEELFFRAFLFYIIYEALKTIIKDPTKRAIFMMFIISPLFGLAHLGNNGATLISTINLMFDAMMMCLPFLITGRLGMSIGIHFAWNLIQGSVFGFAMSGNIAKATIISVNMPDNLFTGGVFGPEGSVLLVVLDLIAVVLILYWKKLKNYNAIVNPIIIKNSNS